MNKVIPIGEIERFSAFDRSHVIAKARDKPAQFVRRLSLTTGERLRCEKVLVTTLQDEGAWPTHPTRQYEIAKLAGLRLEEQIPRVFQHLAAMRYEDLNLSVVHGLPHEDQSLLPCLSLALATGVGEPFNYTSQNGGALSMRLEPTDDMATNTNSTREDFEHHSDDAAVEEPFRVQWIGLLGAVNPPHTQTGYAAIEPVVAGLPEGVQRVLFDARYSVRYPTSFGFEQERWTGPRSILGLDDIDRTTIAWPSYATRTIDPYDREAQEALKCLAAEVRQHTVYTAINPGTFVLLNNLRGLHNRTAIGSAYRLIYRTYLRSDLKSMRQKAGYGGYVFDLHDIID